MNPGRLKEEPSLFVRPLLTWKNTIIYLQCRPPITRVPAAATRRSDVDGRKNNVLTADGMELSANTRLQRA